MIKKIEKLNLYLLLFMLPFGTRKFLGCFLDLGEVGSEFSSVFIYATDFLILGLLGFWLLRTLKYKKQKIKKTIVSSERISLLLFGFLGVALVSVLNSSYPGLGAYRLLRLVEFVALFYYFRSNFGVIARGRALLAFIGGTLFQALVAIFQFFLQTDLGLRWLGESPLGPGLAGVAKFVQEEEKIIRAYGTFPHPNLLAHYLLAGFIFLAFLYLRDLRGVFEKSQKRKLLFWGAVLILELGVLVTFSRALAFIGILSFLFWALVIYKESDQLRARMRRLILGTTLVGVVLVLFFFPYLRARVPVSTESEPIALRASYNRIALEGIKERPLIGAGLGSFVPELRDLELVSWKHQPVHNVFYLVGFETGILGLSLFVLFLFHLSRKFIVQTPLSLEKLTYGLLFIITIGIMFFDHYLWTIQQGQILFWLLLGLLTVRTK